MVLRHVFVKSCVAHVVRHCMAGDAVQSAVHLYSRAVPYNVDHSAHILVWHAVLVFCHLYVVRACDLDSLPVPVAVRLTWKCAQTHLLLIRKEFKPASPSGAGRFCVKLIYKLLYPAV